MSKMKKFMSALTAMTLTTVSAVSMVASAMSVSDILYEDKTVGYYNVRLYSDHCEILSCTDNTLTEAVIPDYIEGLPVTNVAAKLFMDFDNLTSVDFGSKSKSFDGAMFVNCDALTEITFPEWVSSIPGNMFNGCSNLKKVVMTCDAEDFQSINAFAFFDCTSLETVIIPDDGVTIGRNISDTGAFAFYNCDSLETISIPLTKTNMLYGYQFAECDNLKEISFGIGDDISSAERYIEIMYLDYNNSAFSNCTNLTSITCNGVEIEFNTEFVDLTDEYRYMLESNEAYLTSKPTTETTEAETTEKVEALLTGDANCDGVVNMADAVTVLLFASKDEIDFSVYGEQFNVDLSEIAYANADVHETGNGVNASDVFVIQQYATGVIESL